MFEKRRRSRSTRERVVHSLPCGARANAPLHTTKTRRGERELHCTRHTLSLGAATATHTQHKGHKPPSSAKWRAHPAARVLWLTLFRRLPPSSAPLAPTKTENEGTVTATPPAVTVAEVRGLSATGPVARSRGDSCISGVSPSTSGKRRSSCGSSINCRKRWTRCVHFSFFFVASPLFFFSLPPPPPPSLFFFF